MSNPKSKKSVVSNALLKRMNMAETVILSLQGVTKVFRTVKLAATDSSTEEEMPISF